MKLISVIVPVYNTEKYIEKCVMSILNRTLLYCYHRYFLKETQSYSVRYNHRKMRYEHT